MHELSRAQARRLAVRAQLLESWQPMPLLGLGVVSPITLKPRFNAYATGPAPQRPPEALPPEVDARQLSLFGAGWTLGSLRAVVSSGALSVTYYETTGWRGVMEQAGGSPLP